MTRIDFLEHKLDQLIIGQNEHSIEYRKIASELADIKFSLSGNEINGHKGVISMLEEREQRIRSLEKSRDRNKYTMAGFFAAMQIIAIAIWEWFKK